jgi:hypothetical protein
VIGVDLMGRAHPGIGPEQNPSGFQVLERTVEYIVGDRECIVLPAKVDSRCGVVQPNAIVKWIGIATILPPGAQE